VHRLSFWSAVIVATAAITFALAVIALKRLTAPWDVVAALVLATGILAVSILLTYFTWPGCGASPFPPRASSWPSSSDERANVRGTRLLKVVGQALRWRFVLPIVAALWGLYLGVLHPWLMNWGATDEEVAKPLPGDELAPGSYFTRGITIEAPPSAVWPWIIQIGQDRAGFYSNTWLENLTASNIHNADTIRPEWQARAVGDRVPLARPDLLGGLLAGVSHTDIVALEPQRMIENIPGRFVLQPVNERTTRLVFRESIQSQGPAVTRWLVWDPMHFVMVQRMLRGIKERTEGHPLVPSRLMLAARVGWALAGVSLVAAFVARRRWRSWLTLPLLTLFAPLLATGDWDAGLAGFLAVGVTLIGVLAFGRAWWPPYLLLAAGVLLVLLLAPDPYTVFGLSFAFVVVAVLAAGLMGQRGPEEAVEG